MLNTSKWHRVLFFWVAIYLAFTVLDYLIGRYSDSFEYATKIISTSPLIQKNTGGVKSVRLCWFWGFRYRTGYGNSTAGLDLRVEGVQKTFRLTIDLKQVNYEWTVVHSSVPL